MGKAGKRRTRKHRRLGAARMRSGARIVQHKAKSGRTGSAHAKKVASAMPKR